MSLNLILMVKIGGNMYNFKDFPCEKCNSENTILTGLMNAKYETAEYQCLDCGHTFWKKAEEINNG